MSIAAVLLGLIIYCSLSNAFVFRQHNASWIVNYPHSFGIFQMMNRGEIFEHPPGSLIDNRAKAEDMTIFRDIANNQLSRVDFYTDGEVVDALEHFFWGQTNGVAMELGSLDGSPDTHSMTYEYEKSLGWKRILIDGNPAYRKLLAEKSPLAFGALAAICEFRQKVHFRSAQYVSGIIEFMASNFLSEFHNDIYNAGVPPGNVSSINWSKIKDDKITEVDCMPLNHILQKIHVQHINYFILDVEGGELEVLKSIHWNTVTFDVLCIETEPKNRPEGFADSIRHYLASKGYHNATGQVGRNQWYIHKDFKPSSRPGIDKDCFNGRNKAFFSGQSYLGHRPPPFERCPLTDSNY